MTNESQLEHEIDSTVLKTETPKKLHPTSLLFMLSGRIRNLIVPVLFGGYSAFTREGYGAYIGYGILGFIFFVSFISAILKYVSVRFSIQSTDLIVDEGIISRKHRTIPVGRIQNIDLKQSLLHRLLKVAEVRVETASGTEPEAILSVLSLTEVESLRSRIYSLRDGIKRPTLGIQNHSEELASTNAAHLAAKFEKPTELIHKLSVADLLTAGLLSNRGVVLIGVLVGLAAQFGFADEETIGRFFRGLGNKMNISAEGAAQFMSDWGPLPIILAALAFFVLVKILSIAFYLLRFYGYQLRQSGDDFQVSCGLFTQVSATVPRRRIQFISIHRGMFERWFGLASIRIETAGGASFDKDAAASVSRRWFIPVIREPDVERVVNMLRPDVFFDESSLDWKPLSPNSSKRLRRFSVILSVSLSIAVGVAWFPWGFSTGLFLVPFGLWYATLKGKSLRYTRDGLRVIYRSGVLTRKLSMTFLDKTQSVDVRQSPFDRRWSMATLSVDTAAAGPAGHAISVRLLDQDFANAEFEDLSALAAQKQLQWN